MLLYNLYLLYIKFFKNNTNEVYKKKINSWHFKDYKYLDTLSSSNLQVALCEQTKKYMIIKENY